MQQAAGGHREIADVVRMVARAFYDTETIVVLDGLLVLTGEQRGSIRDEDLASELKLQHKVVRGVLSRLERDLIVRSFERKEQKGLREVQQQYWRIDYKQFLDAVKLRIHRMKSALHAAPVENVTDYICGECVDAEDKHPSWSEFDVQALLDPDTMSFTCPYCQGELEAKTKSAEHGGQVDIHQRLQGQLERLMKQLKLTEDIVLPAPKPEAAFAPAKAGQQKAGGDGVAGIGGGSGTQIQGKKIILQMDSSMGGAPSPRWHAGQAATPLPVGTPTHTPSASIGSFQALQSATDQRPASTAGGPAGGDAAMQDPKWAEFWRQYQEQCDKAEKSVFKTVDENAGGWTGEGSAGGAEGEGDEFDEGDDFDEEGEEGEEADDDDDEEEEETVNIGGNLVRLSEITDDHINNMTAEEYEEYGKKMSG